MSSKPVNTISERIQQKLDVLTRAERQLAHSMLENYPVSSLGSITQVAIKANVSKPTVLRMVRKLGYAGFPDLQTALRIELDETISSPIAKHDNWASTMPDGHILNRFTLSVMNNIQKSLQHINIEDFNSACKLISNTDYQLFISGGRITRSWADYFFLHMQMIRKGVTHIQSISNAWPHYLLDLQQDDVLVIFDIRRYENSSLKLVEMAAKKGAIIILFTDQWRSPISRFSHYCFCNRIDVPSAWDSSVTTILLLEAMIASIQESTWQQTRGRMEALEELFNHTKFFRKFT